MNEYLSGDSPEVDLGPAKEFHIKHHHHKDPNAAARIEKEKHSIFGFFVMRTRLTALVLLAIVVFGGLALLDIPRESDPEVKIPIGIVTTIFPGASPADVENLVTNKIENKIESLDDVKLVTSNSMLGVSTISVEFEAEADLDDSIRNLKDKVLEVTGLPDEAEDPFVIQVRANDLPIITFSFAGPLTEIELKNLGETIQDELEKIPGLSEAALLGVQDRQFAVTVNRGALERFKISLNAIIGAVSVANNNTPLGSITIDETNYNLRAVSKIKNLEDLKKIVVAQVNGQPIFLEDVANVQDQLAEPNNIARLSVGGQQAIPTISIQILKTTGGNILDIVDEAKDKLAEMQRTGVIPAEVVVEVSSDFSQFIRDDLRTLGSSGVFAVIMIFIILFAALSIREATISLVAIPLSFLITFYILNVRGDTLNGLTLFALVLSLGLLVDAFIIILEGIFLNIRLGYTSKEAALLAISHYKKPLIAGTLTTISAFVPMLLVSGILGEFLRVLPITISFVLLSSLFVSLSLVPAMAVVLLKRRGKNGDEGFSKRNESWLEKYVTNKLTHLYSLKIEAFLKSRKMKIKFTAVALLMFVVSFGLFFTPLVGVELFPKVDIDFSFIDIEMPIGTELTATDRVVQEVENYLYTRPEIKTFTTSVGTSSSFGFRESSSSSEHVANINVTFVDQKDRDLESYEINDQMRKDLSSITRGKVTIREISTGPPTGAPIEVRITGDELKIIDELTLRLERVMEQTEGVIDVESDRKASPADLTFTLKREALAQAGLSVGEVSSFLRAAIFGITATEINIDNEEIDVVVKLAESNINSVEKVKNLSITNNRGQSFKLSRLADFSLEPALSTIRHRNFERTATIRANLETGFRPSDIVPQIQAAVASEKIPTGYAYNFGGEVEDIEQSFSELWNAMIVAVLLILFILVLQFDSFKKPFIILLSLPLMLIGVVVGMLIFRLPFSFSIFLGLISLAGIVVNDAIVLLDKADRNIKEFKMKPRQAIANAGVTRLQPILLTSITTMAGILPLAFTDEFWFGLSISIIFGIGFATILQLFVIPMVYLKLEGKRTLKKLVKQP